MNKYLELLKERLLDYQIDDSFLLKIISEYKEKIAKLENDDFEYIKTKFGNPSEEVNYIVKKYQLKLKENEGKETKTIISIVPFISFVSFLILGFGFDFWHPGWLVFIIVPIIVLVFTVFDDNIISGLFALIPFIIIISYFFVGFYLGIWHPTWLIFILLPLIGVFSNYKSMSIKSFLFVISPFIALIIYIILGSVFHLWSKLWVVFLLVPMIGVLQEHRVKRIIIYEISLFLALIIGIVTPYITSSWGYSFLGLLIPALVFISYGEDSIIKFTKETIIDWLVFLFLAIIFLVFGIVFNAWGYIWMILLIFPAYEILKQSPDNAKFYYIMPFISIIIFYSLGYFYNLWMYSWLAFLLVPIVYFIERDE
ncbi:MAG: hypothetical protein R6U15_00795 [Candidatus Izemoplasmatales bacterium]